MRKLKLIPLLLALCLITSMFFGCNGDTNSEQEATTSTVDSESAVSPAIEELEPEEAESSVSTTEPVSALEEDIEQQAVAISDLVIENPYSFPLTTNDITLTMWCDLIPPLFNHMPNGMADNLVYQTLQERSGVTLDITSTPITSAADQVSLILASGEYPDIWSGFSTYYTNGLEEAVEEELIIDLAEYKENFPSFFSIIDNYPAYGKNAYTDTGKVCVLNGIWTDPSIDVGLTIRKDWLEELNMEVPTTLDGFYELLTIFHDQYGATYFMNQNSSDPVNSFAQCFGVVGNASDSTTYAYYMAKDGTEVAFSPLEDGFRDYLSTMAQWYSEGLIYEDFLSASDSIPETDILLDGQIGITYYSVSNYTTLMGQVSEGDTFDLLPVEVPVNVETGEAVHLGRQAEYTSAKGFSLSTNLDDDSEEFSVACKFLDYLYTDEGSELCNYGVEDITFTYGDNGEHVWTDLMLNNPNGLAYSWCLNCYTIGAGSFRIDSSRTMNNYGESELNMIETWNNTENDASEMIPTALSLTPEESAAYSATFSDIRTHVQQSILEFITGSKSMEEYDSFVGEIQSMGIDECTQILQDALDRYNQR